jgi:alkanesulfonate monooxygenase SsuD/methylene tetrahydromethanopterin reductase-like flavin-dependent oxidoreductase (luciferase family)
LICCDNGACILGCAIDLAGWLSATCGVRKAAGAVVIVGFAAAMRYVFEGEVRAMRVGLSLLAQNFWDWDRFEARERDEDIATAPCVPDSCVFAEEIAFGMDAEPLGFDSLWTIEHHFTPYTMVTHPLQFLTYFAGRSERLDMGSMVMVLPWHHPLRVAEAASMLQGFLGEDRNLYLGVGHGAGRREFNGFGIDMGSSRALFAESVDVLRMALTSEQFSYEGQQFRIPETALRPQLGGARIVENMYGAWGSAESVPIIAGAGLRPILNPRRRWSEYDAELNQFASVRAEIGLAPAQPITVVWAYCAATEQQAQEGAYKYMREYTAAAVGHYELGDEHIALTKGYEFDAAMRGRGDMAAGMAQTWIHNHLWGTPEQCIEKLHALNSRIRPSQFVFVMKFASMSLAAAQRSTRLFAREVIPVIHGLPENLPAATSLT